jgi:hypothetical protein
VERLVKKLGVLLTSQVNQINKKTAPAIINPTYSDDQTPDVIPAIAPATVKKRLADKNILGTLNRVEFFEKSFA